MTTTHPFLSKPVRSWLEQDHATESLHRRVDALEEVIREWADASQVRDCQVAHLSERLEDLEGQGSEASTVVTMMRVEMARAQANLVDERIDDALVRGYQAVSGFESWLGSAHQLPD